MEKRIVKVEDGNPSDKNYKKQKEEEKKQSDSKNNMGDKKESNNTQMAKGKCQIVVKSNRSQPQSTPLKPVPEEPVESNQAQGEDIEME